MQPRVRPRRAVERVAQWKAAGVAVPPGLHEPVRKSPTGSTITYITDPWGTRIEIIQRAPLGPQVQ